MREKKSLSLSACFDCHVCLCDKRKLYDWTRVCTKIKSIFHAFVLKYLLFQNPDVSFFYFNMRIKAQSLVQIESVRKKQPLKMKGERRMFLNQKRIREKINPTMKILLWVKKKQKQWQPCFRVVCMIFCSTLFVKSNCAEYCTVNLRSKKRSDSYF